MRFKDIPDDARLQRICRHFKSLGKTVHANYLSRAQRAEALFHYQVVYNPYQRSVCHLTTPPLNTIVSTEATAWQGPWISNDDLMQLGTGQEILNDAPSGITFEKLCLGYASMKDFSPIEARFPWDNENLRHPRQLSGYKLQTSWIWNYRKMLMNYVNQKTGSSTSMDESRHHAPARDNVQPTVKEPHRKKEHVYQSPYHADSISTSLKSAGQSSRSNVVPHQDSMLLEDDVKGCAEAIRAHDDVDAIIVYESISTEVTPSHLSSRASTPSDQEGKVSADEGQSNTPPTFELARTASIVYENVEESVVKVANKRSPVKNKEENLLKRKYVEVSIPSGKTKKIKSTMKIASITSYFSVRESY